MGINFKIGRALAISSIMVGTANAYQYAEFPEIALKAKLKGSLTLEELGEQSFGEQFDVQKGYVDFNQADIETKGAMKLFKFARHYESDSLSIVGHRAFKEFGDWALDFPTITTTTSLAKAGVRNSYEWLASDKSGNRCSNMSMPSSSQGGLNVNNYVYQLFWRGVLLKTTGGKSEYILKPSNEYQNFASNAALVTTSGWKIVCGASTANGAPGQSFLAYDPEGTQYTFDWLAFRYKGHLVEDSSDDYTGFYLNTWYLSDANMHPTRIADKYGNWVAIKYSGREISEVTSSDSQVLKFTWSELQVGNRGPTMPAVNPARIITKVEYISGADSRIWNYNYSVNGVKILLSEVLLPDGRKWKYNLEPMVNVPYVKVFNSYCTDLRNPDTNTRTGTITHPSGLVGRFTVQQQWHLRKNPAPICETFSETIPYVKDPDRENHLTLVSKEYSGNEISSKWSYKYSAARVAEAVTESTASQGLSTTTITNPDGSVTAYTFNNEIGALEGKLLQVDTGAVLDSAGKVTSSNKREIYTYSASATGLPAMVGSTFIPYGDKQRYEKFVRQTQLKTIVDGTSFIIESLSFDTAGRVLKTKKYNSYSSHKLEENYTYSDDKTRWIVGVPLSVSDTNSGKQLRGNLYDSLSSLSETLEYGLSKQKYTWDTNGNLASSTDGMGRTTYYQDYKLDIPRKIIKPDNTTNLYEVDNFGRITKKTDERGSVTTLTYNPIGWLLNSTEAADDSVSWASKKYNYQYIDGNLHVTESVGTGITATVTTTVYDALQRPVMLTRHAGSNSINEILKYDWRGNVVFESYPQYGVPFDKSNLINGITTKYDPLDRTQSVIQDSELGKLTTSIFYTPDLKTQITDPQGNITKLQHLALDTPTYEVPIFIERAGSGIVQTITRDVFGKPINVVQSGVADGNTKSSTIKYLYDNNERLCGSELPERGAEIFGRDNVGNIIWSAKGLPLGTQCDTPVLAKDKVVFTYDSMDRLTKTEYPDGTSPVILEYDLTGETSKATSGNSTWNFSRNKRGLLTSETLTIAGGESYKTSYDYSEYGYISGATYPNNKRVAYDPDSFGRTTKVGSYASDIQYYANGDIKSFTYGNGINFRTTQNLGELVSNFTYARGQTEVFNQSYIYDKNRNTTSAVDATAAGTRQKNLSYDSLNRLSVASAPKMWGEIKYSYDSLNNIKSTTINSNILINTYDQKNLISEIKNGSNTLTSYSHDSHGNMIARGGVNIAFNDAGQIIKYGDIEEYKYDALGNRYLKLGSTTGADTIYGYSSSGPLLFEHSDSSLTSYYYIGSRLIAKEVE